MNKISKIVLKKFSLEISKKTIYFKNAKSGNKRERERVTMNGFSSKNSSKLFDA